MLIIDYGLHACQYTAIIRQKNEEIEIVEKI